MEDDAIIVPYATKARDTTHHNVTLRHAAPTSFTTRKASCEGARVGMCSEAVGRSDESTLLVAVRYVGAYWVETGNRQVKPHCCSAGVSLSIDERANGAAGDGLQTFILTVACMRHKILDRPRAFIREELDPDLTCQRRQEVSRHPQEQPLSAPRQPARQHVRMLTADHTHCPDQS